ncbi:MAG: aminodeoxychorismate lyase [Idiomarina sp.]|nr:MAG: aminodeoxychorismate lyase [Idiomarina sp.]
MQYCVRAASDRPNWLASITAARITRGCEHVVFKRFIQIFVGFTVIAAAAIVAGLGFSYQQLQQPLDLEQPILFEVKRGMHARTILEQLNTQGADIRVTPVYVASRLFDIPQRLQAGVYEIHPSDNVANVWRKLRQGEQYLFQVTLVEGRTFAEWLSILDQADRLIINDQGADLATVIERLNERLGTTHTSFEGLLYPDTYKYTSGTKAIDILVKAYQRMQSELTEIWAQRSGDLPYEKPYELLIMASIIEKETGIGGERGKVSSVFINRLRKGMRLQSDPTTIYGIENFDGNLTRVHLRELTPFNTYRIDGLPPTPIAMPSRESLIAAAHPEQTDYYYFVADGSGGHVFSKTLVEHNRAVNRYQRNQG